MACSTRNCFGFVQYQSIRWHPLLNTIRMESGGGGGVKSIRGLGFRSGQIQLCIIGITMGLDIVLVNAVTARECVNHKKIGTKCGALWDSACEKSFS